MKWSHYSEAIFDAYQHDLNNLMVQACPGAGKTTNIKHMWTLDSLPTVYLVFNKANQLEAQEKLPQKPGSSILTLNGLGHRALMNTFGNFQFDVKGQKILDIIDRRFKLQWSRLGRDGWKIARERRWLLKKAVEIAKFTCFDTVCTNQDYAYMLSQYDLESYPGMQEDIGKVLDENDSNTDLIDFGDQIRIPALYDIEMPEFKRGLFDEVQDFNSMQALLVSKLNCEKMVFVGDKRQSIYGFRGAMLDSMDYLRSKFGCVELPLSITYRCAKNVVKEAYAIWPDIEAWDESPDGMVQYISADSADILSIMRTITTPEEGIVLCRTNAPLVSFAYDLLTQGIACHVRGRDIGQGLIKLVEKFPVSTVRDLIACVQEWEAVELAKAQSIDDGHKAQSIQDKAGSLSVFMERCRLDDHPEAVIAAINKVFEQGKGVVLSTVHKAKGLEAESAYMLAHGLFDTCIERSKQPWQAEQERNVKYVGVTRAKTALVYM